MKHKLLSILLFLYSNLLFAQASTPTAEETENTDLFLTYWPIALLPIFMIVIWGVYRKRNKVR